MYSWSLKLPSCWRLRETKQNRVSQISKAEVPSGKYLPRLLCLELKKCLLAFIYLSKIYMTENLPSIFFLLWWDTRNVKCTILTISKWTVQWHKVHLPCCTSNTTAIHRTLLSCKTETQFWKLKTRKSWFFSAISLLLPDRFQCPVNDFVPQYPVSYRIINNVTKSLF